MDFTLSELVEKSKEQPNGSPLEKFVPPTPVTKTPQGLSQFTLDELQAPQAPKKTSLTVDDVKADPERLSKIRRMMSTAKDIKYETADPDEVMKDFMAHMRFLNTNELSIGKEAMNVLSADDQTKAIYGDAYKVYEDMGSMFSNGDFWGGTLDYAQSFVTSPSLYLGLGIGKLAGNAGTKAVGTKVMSQAINTAAKEAARKSGGKVTETLVQQQLRNTASKVTARNAILGAVAVEAPFATASDYLYQDIMMETDVQETFSYAQSALSTLGGAAGAIIPAGVLLRSRGDTLANAGNLIQEANKKRAKGASKRAAEQVKSSLQKAQIDWLKLAEAGIAADKNQALKDGITQWFLDINREDSFVRILQKEGAELRTGKGEFTESLLEYAKAVGDEGIEGFNEALAPLGIQFGEAIEILAGVMRKAGQDQNLSSQASKFMQDFQNVSVAKRAAKESVVRSAGEMGDEVELDEAQVLAYIQSTWKKTLVSTFPTTAVNVKGWALARSAKAVADVALAGGLLGKAGIRAVVNPTGAVEDLMKVKAIAENQAFMLNTLVDPFLSAEGFLSLLEKAPTKIKKELTGQIFGGVEDFSPKAFGLNPDKGAVKYVEKLTNAAQQISFVRLQDTLTKGISGITALDRESRLAFNKGIKKLIEDGETYKLTDEMWDKAMKGVLEETFSEDFSRGKGLLAQAARAVQNISNHPIGGFVVPFGKFMNNTMAFMYRYSLVSLTVNLGRVFKGGKNLEEDIAKGVAGTMALVYMAQSEAEKQAEGLQWFERRTQDGQVEDITTLFPYSVYALVGRITHNSLQGEGMSLEMLNELTKQMGPLDAVGDLAAPAFIQDVLRYLADDQVEGEERSAFFDIVGFAAESVGGIAAGFTRPLELPLRTIAYNNPEMGGGVLPDIKQAEGVDKFVMAVTRNVAPIFHYLLGEQTEEGVRLYGEPRQSSLIDGPVRSANPVGTLTGTTLQPPAKNLNKLLGMVDKPPFRAESFTSGVAAYDAFINKNVTKRLESEAARLLKTEAFLKAPKSLQIEMVDGLIQAVRADLVGLLEGGYLGNQDDRLINERRKLMVMDRQARARAKEALDITVRDNKLTMYQIEAIKNWIALEKEQTRQLVR